MTTSLSKLAHPPIVESVLDIDCDLRPDLRLDSLEEPAQEAFRSQYPLLKKVIVQEHKIEAKPEAQPKVSVRSGLQALQFVAADEKQIVQVRVPGFSFNRLAPYSTLDDYLLEIERTWNLFVTLARPIQVRRITLRTINRIPIPLVEARVDLDDFFAVGPRLPDVEGLELTGFFHQHNARETSTGHQVNLVLTAQPPEKAVIPVIFDSTVVAESIGDPEEWKPIATKIHSLRGLRNRLFEHTVTQRCLELFR